MKILVTGGAGYIGSHTVLELLSAEHEVCVVDNLCNSNAQSLERVSDLTGKPVDFHEVDLRDRVALGAIMAGAGFDAVVHFAALKSVGESVEQPLAYYDNNINGTLVLCELMREHAVKNLVFSSSATVYGDAKELPITEVAPLRATNPYGQTKLMMEQILRDYQHSDPLLNIAILRYFNPVGAHESGLIGEDPNGIPSNLFPYVAQVAVGRRQVIQVLGADYPTPDGTGVRDYIHVVDLAKGHLYALDKLNDAPGLITCNLGTGRGYSVLEVIKAFGAACGKELAYELMPRRLGDVAACYADPAYAKQLLGWQTERDLATMCADAWRWQSTNPHGYVG
ncbi:MAG TPA: UDP-glucose 4-epimerase GalE [Opitutae bacterium]|jgi:UDP-glucose 4-epimerase|nr:UDP-glucose 4-epimerase GalE [Opitutae bacterium]